MNKIFVSWQDQRPCCLRPRDLGPCRSCNAKLRLHDLHGHWLGTATSEMWQPTARQQNVAFFCSQESANRATKHQHACRFRSLDNHEMLTRPERPPRDGQPEACCSSATHIPGLLPWPLACSLENLGSQNFMIEMNCTLISPLIVWSPALRGLHTLSGCPFWTAASTM